jgi:hypothetical protein
MARLASALALTLVSLVVCLLLTWFVIAPLAIALFGGGSLPYALVFGFPILLLAAYVLARRRGA